MNYSIFGSILGSRVWGLEFLGLGFWGLGGGVLRWILKCLQDPKYLIPWELWYYSILRSCRIFSINNILTAPILRIDYSISWFILGSRVWGLEF